MKTYTTIDKTTWGDGPWQAEPDKVQWVDKATGLDCLAVRHQHSGHWCGYVGVSPDHPLHGCDYNKAESLDVHGGITFAEGCDEEGDEARNICHVPEPGRPDNVWWLGFDCAHAGDASPVHDNNYPSPLGEYRPLPYVQAECASLARQLAATA